MTKKGENGTIISTVISAVVLIAVFVACFFMLLKTSEAVPADVLSSSGIIESSLDSSPSKEETSHVSSKEQKEITLSFPQKDGITVTEGIISVSGSCDPEIPLYINGKEVIVTADGTFSEDVELKRGKNTLKITQKEKTVTRTVTYRYVVINGYTPSSAKNYTSGSDVIVSVTARKGSMVTATFNGKTITLTTDSKAEDTFISYTGMFTLPKDNLKDINLGKIKFAGSFDGAIDTFYSGDITVKKTSKVSSQDSNVTPSGGSYIDVGSGYIAEIVQFQAETFDGKYTANNADWSRPTNNYLPKGTVDYCSTGLVYDKSGEASYVTLRCGRRVYLERTDTVTDTTSAVVKRYIGKLPDHNEIALVDFKVENNHTYLVLHTLFNAPFYFKVGPQNYEQPSTQDYRVSEVTYSYVDITFCYATIFKGEIEIPNNHPLFKSAKLIQNNSDCTLRLYLKKAGAFYGWDAYYNDKGQLTFSFLNPAFTVEADNEYGRDLTGTTVVVDAGHGGKDCGALGIDPSRLNEAKANLKLAKIIKAELEKTGATVILTRSKDTYLSADERHLKLKEIMPDYCISVHHDANNSSRLNGFGSFYFSPFSKKASEFVYKRNISTGIYNQTTNNRSRLDWHYFFLARNSVCPVVLTENGYITNSVDFSSIANDTKMLKKAKAIVAGVVDYFEYICPAKPYTPKLDIESSVEQDSTSRTQSSTGAENSSVESSSIVEASSVAETSSDFPSPSKEEISSESNKS